MNTDEMYKAMFKAGVELTDSLRDRAIEAFPKDGSDQLYFFHTVVENIYRHSIDNYLSYIKDDKQKLQTLKAVETAIKEPFNKIGIDFEIVEKQK